jgi:hypothetical protein
VSSTALSGLGFSSRVLGLHLISLWKVLPLISPSATSMQPAAAAPLGEPSAQDRRDVTFVLRNQLPQIFHLGESEGNGLLVLAKEFGGTADGDCGGPRHHGQAVPAIGIAWRQFQGSSAARSVIL